MTAKNMDLIGFLQSMNDPNSPFYVPKFEFEMIPFKGLKHGLKRYNDHLLPMIVRNPTVVKNLEVRGDDTFVVTFPKSGTHWVSELCWLIQNNMDFERARTEPHSMRTPFLDVSLPNNFLKQMQSPRVFMTHFEYDLLPDDLNKKSKVL